MAWRRSGDKPLSEPMMIRLLTHICVTRPQWVNMSPLSVAYMHQLTGSSLVQVMACCLFGTKPLPEPMLAYCKLDSWEQIPVKLEWKHYHFHSRKCIWKCGLPKWRPFCPGGSQLTLHGLVGIKGIRNSVIVWFGLWVGTHLVWHTDKLHHWLLVREIDWSLVDQRVICSALICTLMYS